MLNEYKNGLLDVLKREGFDPELFVAEEYGIVRFLSGFKLTFADTPLWFSAENPKDSYELFTCFWTAFSPGFTQRSSRELLALPEMYEFFVVWLNSHVRKYLDSLLVPNLWEQIETQKKLLSFDAVAQDTGFYSDDEKAALRSSLNTAKLFITERFSPSEDQVEMINERFDYLAQSLDRLSKRDWKSLLLSYAKNGSVSPWRMCAKQPVMGSVTWRLCAPFRGLILCLNALKKGLWGGKVTNLIFPSHP